MKRTLKTTAALAAPAWLLPATPASAQDDDDRPRRSTSCERDGGSPAIRSWQHRRTPRQSPSSARRPGRARLAELDCLRRQAGRDRGRRLAPGACPATMRMRALMGAASTDLDRSPRRGKPYARAFDLLVQLHEGGITDRAGLDANHDYDDNWSLSTIFRLDPKRGPAVCAGRLRAERAAAGMPVDPATLPPTRCEPPECVRGYQHVPPGRPWCRAWDISSTGTSWATPCDRMPRRQARIGAAGYPRPVPDGLPEHVEDWYRRCQR